MIETVVMKSEHHMASLNAISSVLDDINKFEITLNKNFDCDCYEPELLNQASILLNSIDSKVTILSFYLKNTKTECHNNMVLLSDFISSLIYENLWVNNDKDSSLISGNFSTDIRPLYEFSFNGDDLKANIVINAISDETAYSFLSIWNFIRDYGDKEIEQFSRTCKFKFDDWDYLLRTISMKIRERVRPILSSPNLVMNLSIPDKRNFAANQANEIINEIQIIKNKLEKMELSLKNIHDCEVALLENQDIFMEFHKYCSSQKPENLFASEGTVTLI